MTGRKWAWCSVIALVTTGCQRYEPRPLALEEHAVAWSARALDIAPIQHYAAAIAGGAPADGPFDSADGLSLIEAEAVALHFNTRLRLARARADVPLVVAQEAGWWPDPELQAQVLRFANRGRRSGFRLDGPSIDGVNSGLFGASGLERTPLGFRRVEGDFIDDPWIVNASLNITVPVSGRLAVEQDLRWAEYDATIAGVAVAEWEVITALRAAWLTWSTEVERLRVTREYITRLEEIGNIAGQLADAGEMKPTESRVLHIELARQRARMPLLVSGVERSRLAVFALLGVAPEAPLTLVAETFLTEIVEPGESRDAIVLTNHPRIQAARRIYEAAQHRLRLEVRQQIPDLQVGPGFSFEEGFTRLGLGFGFPLPLWNRNRQAIAQASAERDAARVSAAVEVETALAEVAQAMVRWHNAARQSRILLEEVAPLVDRQLEDSRTLLGLGEIDVLLLRDALSGSLTTRLDILDATLAQATAANELAQMLHPRWMPTMASAVKEVE